MTGRTDGKFYHHIGILNFWWNGYTEGDTWFDPPKLSHEFYQWLVDHDAKYVESYICGPPMIEFNTYDDVQKFKYDWFDPGQVQNKSYKEWCHRPKEPGHFSTHDEMTAAYQVARAEAAKYRLDREHKETE